VGVKVMVVMPVYNEKGRVVRVIKRILKEYKLEVVVVDDGSTDDSFDILKRNFGKEKRVYLLRHILNLGKGAAMKTGVRMVKKIKGEAVLFVDSDGQHNPKQIREFLKEIEKFDLVFGYRDVGNRMPRVRRWGNLIAKKIVKTLFGIERKDMLCGFFAFKMSVFPKIRWKSSRYGVETEIAVRVVKSGLCFKEIKVDTIYINKYKGVSIFDAVRILMRLPYWYFGIKK